MPTDLRIGEEALRDSKRFRMLAFLAFLASSVCVGIASSSAWWGFAAILASIGVDCLISLLFINGILLDEMARRQEALRDWPRH